MTTPLSDDRKFCPFCGHPYDHEKINPRTCSNTVCGRSVWSNPIPVGVLLQPVDGGLLIVKRGIPPQLGCWALPGGFLILGETWQEGTAREVDEELRVRVDARDIAVVDVTTPPKSNVLIVHGLARRALRECDLPPFVPNEEASDRGVLREPTELAFPSHTNVVQRYFAGEFNHLLIH